MLSGRGDGQLLRLAGKYSTLVQRVNPTGYVEWTYDAHRGVGAAVATTDGDVLVHYEPSTVARVDGNERVLASEDNCSDPDIASMRRWHDPLTSRLLFADTTGYVLADERGP